MITARERIKLSELFTCLINSKTEQQKYLNYFLPLSDRYFIFTNMGKAAFEQIVISANLENSKILLPAFFPDDFVGIFQKYNITPVFVDIHPDSYHLNLALIDIDKLSDIKALILLHTFGLPADGKKYRDFCDEHRILLIEDCARAFGASYNGQLAGSFGQYSIFSLPKCTPVRQGGLAISETPIKFNLDKAKIGFSGLLHNLTLIKYPFLSGLEPLAYKVLADTTIYPREVGIYNLLPSREFDKIGKYFLYSYIPNYKNTLLKKNEIAKLIKSNLETYGYKFQMDNGNHIYTSVSLQTPENCRSEELIRFLYKNGVKASSMWSSALGISKYSQATWGINPNETPVTLNLSKRIVQLPVNRFQNLDQSHKIIELCIQFASKQIYKRKKGS